MSIKKIYESISKNISLILKILIVIIFYIAVAVLGISFTNTSTEWYSYLLLPKIQPSPTAFMYIWSFLYLLLIVITSLAVLDDNFSKRLRNLLLANGILNVLWSYAFFEINNPFGSLIILLAFFYIAYLIFQELNKIKPLYAYLFIPYLAWLVFALYLNYSILFLNPLK